MHWREAFGWFTMGGVCTLPFTFGYGLQKAIKRREAVRREAAARLKRLKLEREGRAVPRRSDAAPGASRVHKAITDPRFTRPTRKYRA